MTTSLSKQTRDEKRAQHGKREVILRLLKERGSRGMTNLELGEVCQRFGARLWELKKVFVIERESEGLGVYRYIYCGVREPKQRSLFAA